MKESLDNNIFCPRTIVNKALEGKDIEVISCMGDFKLLYRNLRNQRLHIINPLPYRFPSIKISEILSKTHTGQDFYQYGPDNYRGLVEFDNILILFSSNAVNSLRTYNTWCIDGTFKILSSSYHQLVTIGYLRDHHVFPVIFGILKNKNSQTYNNFLRIVKELIPDLSPLIVKVDFEYSLMKALKTAFPESQISGCLFHLSQSIIRYLQVNGLISHYKIDNNFKKYVKALYSLAFVKKEEVENTFNELKNSNSFPEILVSVYSYFYNTYIKATAKYPIEIWNFSQLLEQNIPRTNNAIEGWHYIFKSSFNSSRKSLPILFLRLKDEEDAVRIKKIRMDLGYELERNKKYVAIERNLFNYLQAHRNSLFGMEFVMGLIDLIFY